jgi:hypothetical protein
VLHLVDCSMIVPPHQGGDGRVRYTMLETLRAFGQDQLAQAGEADGAAEALARFAVGVAEQAAPQFLTDADMAAERWLDAEAANLQQAVTWSLEHDPPAALRLAVSLGLWWHNGATAARAELRRPRENMFLGSALRSVPGGSAGWSWTSEATVEPDGAQKSACRLEKMVWTRSSNWPAPWTMASHTANGNNATITASDVQPSPAVVTAAEALLAQAGGYASAAAGSTQMQAFVTQAEPTKANTAGILDQPLAEIVQAAADGASWGLGLVQDGVDTMFGLAGEAIDGACTMLTQTWDIPLVTDIYKWVTNGSDLSALDVSCLLLAVPATITYKVMFGEAPIPDQAGLDAIMAAYPAPPATGSDRALAAPADAPSSTALVIGQRLGNILTGLSYIACGHFEAQVDLGIALWTVPGSTEPLEDPRCPAGWRGQWWVEKPGMIWEALYVATEVMSSVFSWVVTFAPNSDNLDCGTVEGMANWMWIIGNLQWILDFTALVFEGTVVQALWQGTGPGFITLWGCVQLAMQIVIWFRLGTKGWPGSAGGLLTSLPNAGKFLMSPYLQKAFDNVPIPALIEAMIDGAGNLYGGLLYVLNAAIPT